MATYHAPNVSACAFFINKCLTKKSTNIVFISKDDDELQKFVSALHTFIDKNTPYKIIVIEDNKYSIYSALEELLNPSKPLFVVCTLDAIKRQVAGRKDYAEKVLKLHTLETISRNKLLETLENLNYQRVDFTEVPSQYAVRGSVVDIFPINSEKPCRIFFRVNKISQISFFDLETQNTTNTTDEVSLLPFVFEETPSTLARWLKDFESFSFDTTFPTDDIFSKYLTAHTLLTPLPMQDSVDLHLRSPLKFNAKFALFDSEIANLNRQNYISTFFCLNRGELERLTEIFSDYSGLKTLKMTIAPLQEGFYSTQEHFAFFTSAQFLERSYKAVNFIKSYDSNQVKHIHFKELEIGDYVVHQEHGIGRYNGIQTLDDRGVPLDCLIIEFKAGQKLFVPINDFRKVQKYIGLKGRAPKISSLHSLTWKEVKKKVKDDAKKTAKEILQAAALRASHKADILLGNDLLERQFADSFPYEETPDQRQAINDILQDLEKDIPMDRVLVGDVGFGKTEVALRAGLHTALSGKQTALLVPTTVLASQHYKTFSERLKGYPIKVEMLCRFQTKQEQKKIIENIKQGQVDIVIGTHRLLSKDISFKNLGLCMVDEEHRFGVKQKEKIKALSIGVHTLMLSATPIPRTLNQSLSSLREMSIIQTAPQGRMPIKTRLMAYDDEIVISAVKDELAHGGQVFYLYNSVATMQEKCAKLKSLLPEVKIAIAHGQMKEQELETTLWDFYNKKYDLLLCSTIVESGLDVTNANTLIVENPQNFGLAQLYQLRGRIGRGNTKAYCYLLVPQWVLASRKEEENEFFIGNFPSRRKKKSASEEAQKRLTALMEFSELGSGFKLAVRDLEIRGGGDLLGIRQHGYVNAVGLTLYCDLVSNEVKRLKGEVIEHKTYATISLKIPAYIPPDYLPSDDERLRFYKNFLGADEEHKKQLKSQLEDMCGPAPKELLNLLDIMQLSSDAANQKIRSIESGDKCYDFYFFRNLVLPDGIIPKLMAIFSGKIEFLPSVNGDGFRIFSPQNDKISEVKNILRTLQNIFNKNK